MTKAMNGTPCRCGPQAKRTIYKNGVVRYTCPSCAAVWSWAPKMTPAAKHWRRTMQEQDVRLPLSGDEKPQPRDIDLPLGGETG